VELREIDIWKMESQEKVRKMSEEWAVSLLGKRAKRLMNAPTEEANNAERPEAANASGSAGY